jgi:hypothetical protein
MTMTTAAAETGFASPQWVSRWVDVINADPEISRLGQFFDGRMCVQFGGNRYILTITKGRVTDVLEQPIWDKPFDFKIAADQQTWARSAERVPRPFYQDIFAMMWNHGMTLEGDVVKAMQHIRVVKLMLAAMKRVADS